MIVGTAGHVDHGKTALVRALTGTDTDRLPEEKRRGMTIDLGFAYLATGDGGTIGFVDVPGHERFVGTMAAGAAGVDLLLLAVAADDGVMPQTREHLAIAELLGVRRGLVALTKADLADRARRAAVEAEIRAALAGTVLQGAEIVPVSTVTGENLGDLRQRLEAVRPGGSDRDASGRFRLAVDRVFVVAGAGTVVTGTVLSGSVASGDTVLVSPSGRPARVRSVQSGHRSVDRCTAGQRCALNLAGLDRTEVRRGDSVLDPTLHAPTDRIDVRIRMLRGEPKRLDIGANLRLHHAAAEVPVRIVAISPGGLAPGREVLAQLVLDGPIAAAAGDRFVLRDPAARRTVGGGTMLDLRPPLRGRSRPERLDRLEAHAEPNPDRSVARLLDLPPFWLDLTAFCRDRGLAAGAAGAIVGRLGLADVRIGDAVVALTAARRNRHAATLIATLAAFHAENPDLQGLGSEPLRLGLEPRLPRPVHAALVKRLVEAASVAVEGSWVRLPGHVAQLSPADEELWVRIAPHLRRPEDRFRPPRVRDLAATLDVAEADIRRVCRLVGRSGRLDQVANDHFFAREAVAEMALIAADLARRAPGGAFTAAQFRDRIDGGRKVAIQILEFFDRAGVTMRRGDLRRTNPRRADLFGGGTDEETRP